jgi:hypothetical protein
MNDLHASTGAHGSATFAQDRTRHVIRRTSSSRSLALNEAYPSRLKFSISETAMNIRNSVILISLATISLPAFASYTEQWMSSGVKTQASPGHASAQSVSKKAKAKPTVASADDDPIAAFADPQSASGRAKTTK